MCATTYIQRTPNSTASITNAHSLKSLYIKKANCISIMTLSFILVFPSPDFLRDLRSAFAAIPYNGPIIANY